MTKDDNTIIAHGTPEYNQYLMGIAGGLMKYGFAEIKNVNTEEFKADLEKRFMMEIAVITEGVGIYILQLR